MDSTIMKSWDDIRRDATQFAKNWRLAYDNQANDRAVLSAKGFARDLPEAETVARLFERLRELGG